jgi:hypothetical protein
VSGREDTRIVDSLYGELSEKEAREYRRARDEDPALAAEEASFEDTLGLMRQLEDEEPPGHLDSLILARAREEAETLSAKNEGLLAWLRKMIRRPVFGLALAGSVAAVIAVVTVPNAMQSPELTVPAAESIPLPMAKTRANDEMLTQDPAPPPAQVVEEAPKEDTSVAIETKKEARSEREAGRAREASKPSPKRRAPARDLAGADRSDGSRTGESARGDFSFDDATSLGQAPAKAVKPAETVPEKLAEKKTPDVNAVTGSAQPVEQQRAASVPKSEVADLETDAKKQEPPAVAKDVAGPVVADKKAKTAGAKGVGATSTAGPQGGEMDARSAQVYARDIIIAAETQLAARDNAGARRILVNGLQRTRGTTAYGDLALRLAQLDYADRRLADASRNAKAAAAVPRFPRKKIALDLVERVARESGNEADRDWAKEAEKSAAPAAAEEAY